jgi:molybdopterin synthase catalytic subunit
VDLEVRLFAGLREALGAERLRVRLADGATVADLVARLSREHPELAPHAGRFAVAVNLHVASPEHALRAGDEVALLPPVGGGSTDDDQVALTHERIDAAALLAFVNHPGAGGVSLFLGNASDLHDGRRVLRLEYEAYEAMALASLRDLAARTRERFPDVKKLAIVHRLGDVPIGESAVAVVVSCPHRAEAFLACRFAIDALKRDAPIWKKEVFEDGARWVENCQH